MEEGGTQCSGGGATLGLDGRTLSHCYGELKERIGADNSECKDWVGKLKSSAESEGGDRKKWK